MSYVCGVCGRQETAWGRRWMWWCNGPSDHLGADPVPAIIVCSVECGEAWKEGKDR